MEGKGFFPAKRLARSDLSADPAGPAEGKGDRLRLATGGTVAITRIERRRGSFRVNNFTVAGTHTYFAGGVWVHNACPLGTEAKDVLRAEARDLWQQTTGRRAIWDGMDIHHRIPLEYAHIMPGDPNRLANLVAIDTIIHHLITVQWATFRNSLNYVPPTPSQVMGKALDIDRMYGNSMRFVR